MGPWTFGAQYNWRDNGLANAFNGTTNTYNPQYVNLTHGGTRAAASTVALTHGLFALEAHDAPHVRRLDAERRHGNGRQPRRPEFPDGGNSTVWALSGGLWHTF